MNADRRKVRHDDMDLSALSNECSSCLHDGWMGKKGLAEEKREREREREREAKTKEESTKRVH